MSIGILAFLGFMLCVFALLYLHDAILQILHDGYQKEWVKIGRPLGVLFFNPDGFWARFDFRRWRATQNFQYRLLFWAPSALSEDLSALRLLRIYRLTSVLSFVLFILFVFHGI